MKTLKYIVFILVLLALLLLRCQLARNLVGPVGGANQARDKIADAQSVIKQIEKVVKGNDQSELKDALTDIKSLIGLYETNKVSAGDISIMKWLLAVLCILNLIQIGLISKRIKQIHQIN